MIVSMLSRALCAWFALLLPCYSTFKTLSRNPSSQPELETWLMYWCVVGAFMAFEYLAEWLVSWLPFYWELKTLFLLFLSIPQIQGSTYVYNTFLQPFFSKNEADFDASIWSIQQNIMQYLQTRLSSLWDLLWTLVNKTPPPGQPPSSTVGQMRSDVPTLSLESAIGLWRTYGATLLGGSQKAGGPHTPPGTSLTSSFPPTAAADQQSARSQNVVQTPLGSEDTPPPFPEPHHF
ncbi:TB2/DP1, HVA22 family-domain-containing protein [Infundibulicybe gibba]|nr:TB2/DP1, HVA22 family-domain-containing protein [Infundibulicybe gibba]